MKYLISGGTGFLGHHVIARLMDEGHSIVEIDFHKDIKAQCKRVCCVDYIIHMASYGLHVKDTNKREMIKVNIRNTLELLYATKDWPYKSFVNVGTVMEKNAVDGYGLTKSVQTAICSIFAKEYNKPIVTARLTSLYGKGQQDFKFIQKTIDSIKANQPIQVDMNGLNDWLHVDDVASFLVELTKKTQEHKGKIIEVGSGRLTVNSVVINHLFNLLHKVPIEDYKTTRSYPQIDTTEMRRIYRPKISLREGLQSQI